MPGPSAKNTPCFLQTVKPSVSTNFLGVVMIEKIESGPAYMAGRSAMDWRIDRGEKQAALDAQTRMWFVAACRRGDANAMATFAPTVSDRDGGQHARRVPLLHEVLEEALEVSDGLGMSELMQLLLNAASGNANTQSQACNLLNRMIGEWVKRCGPEVTE
jgi:hypothetical protein